MRDMRGKKDLEKKEKEREKNERGKGMVYLTIP
jgi:hypothetical protein